MRLYLVQHGEPLSKEVDPDRPLSSKGRQDVESTARFLSRIGIKVDRVWHSGKTRAAQTAEIMARSLTASGQASLHQGLAPLDPVEPIAQEIESMDSDLLLAGHLPFLSRLASALLLGQAEREVIAFRQGGVVCLERNQEREWRIQWVIPPELAQ